MQVLFDLTCGCSLAEGDSECFRACHGVQLQMIEPWEGRRTVVSSNLLASCTMTSILCSMSRLLGTTHLFTVVYSLYFYLVIHRTVQDYAVMPIW